MMSTFILGMTVAAGVALTVALPSDLLTKRADTERVPNCPTDNSYTFSGAFASPDMKVVRAICNCSYLGDKAGQVGPNSNLAWYQGNQCGNASYADEGLTQETRKAWEISCQCSEVADTEPECLVSDLEGQWMRCFLFVLAEADDTYCSEMRFSDGRVEKGIASCSIAGEYYWGRK
ncbi:uncharacterized protein [Littorina saxatilis]|uniref:uncharacterized protein n=1 Tax=Littorina saxatilis TaxID=31220 RepID=UPI0038B52416